MFRFLTTGKVTGLNSSKDQKTVYLKLLADPVAGLDISKDETPGVLDLSVPIDQLPQGTGIGTRLAVEGLGANTERSWTPHGQPDARPKIISNLRLQAHSVKITK